MKISYTYSTHVTIILDDIFEVPMVGSLDEIVDKIKWCMGEYGFDYADVIDSKTGEILVTVEND